MTSTARRTLTGAATLALTAALVAGTTPAALAGDDDIERRGSCSGSTDWKVKAGPEDGRIEVEAEVDSNRSGQSWRWRLMHNGSLSASGTKSTGGRSGSFEVRRVTVDARGADGFVFRARNVRTGELCRGTVNF